MKYLVVGLGNPGNKYDKTRHNAGFIMLDRFADDFGVKIKKNKSQALIAEAEFEGEKIILVKPQTFMNLSGESVRKLCKWYKILPENVIVAFDDVYIKLGEVRTRFSGSSGGHNGMQNIIDCLGTQNIPRLRLGIGPIPENRELYDFVLGKLSEEELGIFADLYPKFLDGLKQIINKR